MFKIEKYLDKLTVIKESSSVYVCRCPVCNTDNLKISKTNGGWKCWRCQETKKIRDYLSPPNPFHLKTEIDIDKIFIPRRNFKLMAIPVQKPPNIRYYKLTYCHLNYEAGPFDIYYYGETQRVVRGRDKEGNKTIFFSSRKNTCADWEWSKGEENWQPYLLSNLLNSIDNPFNKESNAILFVEGEKVANEISNMGFVTMTIPGHSWNEDWIRKNIKYLKGVKHITYIPDFDEVGQKKALLFQNSCFFGGMSCDILPLQSFSSNLSEHDDFCDLLNEEKIKMVEYLNDRTK